MKDRDRLLQEDFCSGQWPDPWKVLVTCQLLNRTTWVQAERALKSLLERWPYPELISQETEEFYEWAKTHLKPLGMVGTRTSRLYNMSCEITVDRDVFGNTWSNYPVGIYSGCGEYAIDAWFLFVLKKPCDPKDRRLRWYAEREGLLVTL